MCVLCVFCVCFCVWCVCFLCALCVRCVLCAFLLCVGDATARRQHHPFYVTVRADRGMFSVYDMWQTGLTCHVMLYHWRAGRWSRRGMDGDGAMVRWCDGWCDGWMDIYACTYISIYVSMLRVLPDLSSATDLYSHSTELTNARITSVQLLPSGDVVIGFTYRSITWNTREDSISHPEGVTLSDAWVYTQGVGEVMGEMSVERPPRTISRPILAIANGRAAHHYTLSLSSLLSLAVLSLSVFVSLFLSLSVSGVCLVLRVLVCVLCVGCVVSSVCTSTVPSEQHLCVVCMRHVYVGQ